MKKYIILALFLSSCSSEQKRREQEMSQPEPLAFEASSEPEVKDTPVVVAPLSPAPSVKTTIDALDEAIKSQIDEKIYKQASTVLLQNPNDAKALNALGLYHYKKGRFTAAKFFLGKILAVKESSEAYNNLGVVHLALGEKREAVQAFRQALSLNSRDGAAAGNLGAILTAADAYPKAATLLETAYDQGYRDVRILNNYAIALTAQGKGSQAESHYENALKSQPQNRELLFNYAILLIENLKKPKEGLDVLNRLKFVGPAQEQRSRIKDLENRAKLGLQ
jgi:Flp pilus assembly protein TadD